MMSARVKAAGLFAVVFLAGAAIGLAAIQWMGGGGSSSVQQDTLSDTAADSNGDPSSNSGSGAPDIPGRSPQRLTTIEQFADDLGLDQDQRQQIEFTLEGFRSGVEALQRSVRRDYRLFVDSVRAEIESILDSVQVEQYRALLRERYGGDRNGRGEQNGRDEESGSGRDGAGNG